jgi:L-alanine-DL-glutamate epimerase-like enolase superfamily enzyme
MTLKAAFIFLSPEGNADIHRSEVMTESVSVVTYAVNHYEAACRLAATLAEQGITAIELCGGFGTEGVAAVKQAVSDKVSVGVVRFDYHPGLQFRSGDALFG